MYKKVYRQEGGLAEEGYRAQIREAARKKIEDFNRRNRGEVAQRVRTPKPIYAPRRRDNNLNLDSDLLNQAGRLATEYIKNPTKIPTDKGLTTLFHGTPYKEGIMDEGFKSSKVFTTTDPKKALDYAKEGRLRGTPFGPVTGDVLETKVPTSQVESLLKRGLTRTPEVVLSPEEATKIFQTGGGDIVGSPSLLTKIGKTVGRVAGPVGTGLSIADAIARYKAGDYSGAVLSTLSAIPGFGIPATVVQLGTDYLGITGADKDEGGLASLPEAQADEPWSTTDWNRFVSKRKEDPDTDLQYIGPKVQPTVNPLDYQNEFNFRRNYLSDYIDSSQDKFGDEGKLYSYGYIPEVSPMYNATQETGRSFDPQIFSEYQKASDAADRAWGYRYNPEQNTTVNIQPTGFAETGYGQFSPQPTTNIEVPPEVAQNVAVSVTTPGYYNYQEGLNRVLYPGLSGSTGFQNQQQVLPSLMK